MEKTNKEAQASDDNTLYDVILLTCEFWYKLPLVKYIKDVTCLSLKKSKELADTVPSVLLRGVDKTRGLDVMALFNEIGAEIELRPSAEQRKPQ